jgi:hypothetical protein
LEDLQFRGRVAAMQRVAEGAASFDRANALQFVELAARAWG